MARNFKLVALPGSAIVGAGLHSSPAQAPVAMDFKIVSNQYSAPARSFVFNDVKFAWGKQPITTSFKASGEASRDRQRLPEIALVPVGKGGKALTWNHAVLTPLVAFGFSDIAGGLPCGAISRIYHNTAPGMQASRRSCLMGYRYPSEVGRARKSG